MQHETKPKIISLCAGAGLGELGSKPFFETVLAVDSWWRACCSFKANHPETDVRCADIGDELLVEWAKNTYSSVDGIIASTPCPTFSKANSAGLASLASDPRSMIYLAPLKWIEAFQPKFYIAENVDQIISSPYLGLMIARLNRLEYKTECWSLDAADYGTPQHRARLFLIAVRNDLPMPKVPTLTHGPKGSGLIPYRTMGDAIGHLSEEEALSMGCEKLSAFRQWIMATVAPGQNWKSLKGERLEAALRSARSGKPCKRTCSRNDHALPSDTLLTGPSCLGTNSAIHPGYKLDNREFGRYKMSDVADTLSCSPRDNFKRIHPGEKESINNECFARLDEVTPSPTLTTGVNKQRRLYWHPRITRPLSVLEFLRIQGVEVPFYLFGSRGDRYRMAGNGIPPQMMHKVCESVAEAIYGRPGDDSKSGVERSMPSNAPAIRTRPSIIQGDALEVMRRMPDASADCVVTSPPYWMMRDYECEGQIGLEATPDEFVTKLVGVFGEVRRVLKATGTSFVNIGDCYSHGKVLSASAIHAVKGTDGRRHPKCCKSRRVGQAGTLLGIPDRLKAALVAGGWILRMDVIWHKPNKSILYKCNRPALDHEHVLILAKAMGHHWNETVPEAQSSIWTIPVNRQGNGHCASFPMELVRRCIDAGCPEGGMVLDPFAGSGTTGRVAKEMGREFIGVELKPEYAAMANETLNPTAA